MASKQLNLPMILNQLVYILFYLHMILELFLLFHFVQGIFPLKAGLDNQRLGKIKFFIVSL